MPVKPETSLYHRLRDNLPNCLITRVESRVNLGIPDCFIAFRQTGEVVPVELKIANRGRKIQLSPHQVSFHARHAELGVRTFILVLHYPPNKHATKEGVLLLYRGDQVLELVTSGVDTEPVASYHYATVPWSMLMYTLAEA